MLQEIRIRGLGVITEAVLELSAGLNVVTGETGAGKTMVVSGLSLLLGARADPALVRAGTATATIEGLVDVAADHPAARRAVEAGGDVEGGLVLARSISAEGRSRAHVGGRGAPVGVLAELGELLVAVHGQADQWRLRRPEQHRVLLDRFAGDRVAGPLADYVDLYAELGAVRTELTDVSASERERAREVDLLRSGLQEIEAAAPQPDEDVLLRAEDERLAHADELRSAAGLAHALLSGAADAGPLGSDGEGRRGGAPAGQDAGMLLSGARAALGPLTSHDPVVSALADRLHEIAYLAADVSADLAGYLADLDLDPARLAWVQERRALLSRLQRKYGDTVGDVIAWSRQAAERLYRLEHAEERADRLRARLQTLQAELAQAAGRLSDARREAAAELQSAVTEELSHLAMGSATLSVRVSARSGAASEPPGGATAPSPASALPSGAPPTSPVHASPARERTQHGSSTPAQLPAFSPRRFGPHGADDVEILLAAHPGAPGRSVARAASGGELSRVMLALEVVSNSADVPTFVFDEVDAGIGGAAALDVGARLATLSQGAQVIVVTHLAQVAAYADRHLVVRKDDAGITASAICVVTGDERLRELARMMAGASTPVALAHAQELLDRAGSGGRQERSGRESGATSR